MKTYANYKRYIAKNLKLDKISKQIFNNKLMTLNHRLSKKLRYASKVKVILEIGN